MSEFNTGDYCSLPEIGASDHKPLQVSFVANVLSRGNAAVNGNEWIVIY